MIDCTPLDGLLWAAAVFGTLWAVIPVLMSGSGRTVLRFVAEEDPGAVAPPEGDADYGRWYRQLAGLGFRPAGVVTEHSWFLLFHWHRAARVRFLAAPDGRCFAALYRHKGAEDVEALRVALKTPVTGGGVVTTAMPGAGSQDVDGPFLRVEVQGLEPAELLARHREHTDLFARKLGVGVEADSLAGLAARDEEHDRRTLRATTRGTAPTLFAIGFGLPLLLGLWVWHAYGADGGPGRGVAAALCVATAGYALTVHVLMPHLLRQTLAAENPRRD
jgi:hypothetical protein